MSLPSKNRPWLRRLPLLALALPCGYALYLVVSLALLPPVAELRNPRHNLEVAVRDWQGTEHALLLGPKNPHWTPLERIPKAMQWAVVVAEDGRFFEHGGIDVTALKEAIEYDLEQKRLARGASTITQQLAKNLYLSREKTLTRKLKELYLARRLEQELSKERILELYLNLIEVGPLVHGVGQGARYYFAKPAAALTPAECALLAAMLPGPRLAYNPYRNLAKVERRAQRILRFMRQRGVLSEAAYRQALASPPNIAGLQRKVDQTLTEQGGALPAAPAAELEEAFEEPPLPTPDPTPPPPTTEAASGPAPVGEEETPAPAEPAADSTAEPPADGN